MVFVVVIGWRRTDESGGVDVEDLNDGTLSLNRGTEVMVAVTTLIVVIMGIKTINECAFIVKDQMS